MHAGQIHRGSYYKCPEITQSDSDPHRLGRKDGDTQAPIIGTIPRPIHPVPPTFNAAQGVYRLSLYLEVMCEDAFSPVAARQGGHDGEG